MPQAEGFTYEAAWKAKGGRFIAWLKKRPNEKIEGATQEELTEQLWEIAMNAYGDGEAFIELVPPLPAPKKSARYFEPAWFQFDCNEGYRTVGDPAGLYRKGRCSFCRAGLGGRNENERVINGRLSGDLGFLWGARPGARIVSDAFVNFFRPLLGSKMRALSCRSERAGKKRMWELELAGQIPLVCHKNAADNRGIACPKCKWASFGLFVYEPIQKSVGYAVRRPDIEKLKESVVIAFAGDDTRILVNQELATVIKKSGLRGVLLDRVAVLDTDEVGSFAVRKLKRSDL